MTTLSTSKQQVLVVVILLLTARLGFAQETSTNPDQATDDIRELRLADWRPQSMLKTKVSRVNRPAYPVIDVHNHLGGGAGTLTKERVDRYLREMDDAGVRTVINLDGGWDDKLKETVAALDQAHPGRFLTFALIDLRGFDKQGWTDRETARLRNGFESGAKGLKFHKSLGLSYRDEDGNLLGIDDPRLDSIWGLCGEWNKPVMIHTSDSVANLTPLADSLTSIKTGSCSEQTPGRTRKRIDCTTAFWKPTTSTLTLPSRTIARDSG